MRLAFITHLYSFEIIQVVVCIDNVSVFIAKIALHGVDEPIFLTNRPTKGIRLFHFSYDNKAAINSCTGSCVIIRLQFFEIKNTEV